ncbi:MAG: extracellular solute-binding protein [Firmicutes bacterium]|nr:extracellular solute-binding protein [Bacillota bacterium]
MKKKFVSILLIACMLLGVVALTGCQKGSGTGVLAGNFEIPEGGYDGSEVTITFYHTMGSNLSDVLNLYIEEFNKLYPNIHINHEQVGGYDDVRDQIKTELTVGNQPNIAYCYPDHVALYNIARAVVTLDNLIASDIEITRADGTKEILGLTDEQVADFIEGYYNEGKQFGDGLMYTMPMSKSTEVLYYNKTFFEANNLEVPKTWDEMEALCAKILTIDPDCIPLGYDSENNWFITMTEQYGNEYTTASGDNHFLFDNDGNKAFVKEFREWYQKGYVTTQEIYGAYTSGLFVADTGTRSYMSIGSSAGATHQRPTKTSDGYPFEVGIATIPQVDPSKPKVISQGPSLCIFKDANPQEVVASWLFVKFLTTNVDFQAEFSMASGYVPVLKSVSENPAYADFLNKADGGDYISALSAKICLEQESAYYTSPAFNGSSTARDQVGLLMQSAFTTDDGGNLDAMIDQLFKNAIDECNR